MQKNPTWFLTTWLLAFASLLFLLPLNAQAAGDNCLAITGQSSTVLPSSPTLNTGTFNFDLNLNPTYRGCVEKVLAGDVYPLSGWVWNTNLGWTSLAGVGDAAPYTNSGVEVGDFPYQSNLVYNPNSQLAKLEGWWWNDATGWIALNCDVIEVALNRPGYCVGNDFEVAVDYRNVDQLGYGEASGYAWSDSFGWFDMSGVRFPEPANLTVNVVPEVAVVPVDRAGRPVLDDDVVVRALGTDEVTGYKLAVGLRDDEGVDLLADTLDVDFRFTFRDTTIARQVQDTDSNILFFTGDDRGNQANNLLPGKTAVVKNYAGNDYFASQPSYTYNPQLEALLSDTTLRALAPTIDYSQFVGPGVQPSMLNIVNMEYSLRPQGVNGEGAVFAQELSVPLSFSPPLETAFLQNSQKERLSLELGINDPLAVQTIVHADEDKIEQNWQAPSWRAVFWERTEQNQESDYQACLTDTNNFDACEINQEDPVLGYARLVYSVGDRNFVVVLPEVMQLFMQFVAQNNDRPEFEFASGTGVYGIVTYYDSEVRTVFSYVTGALLESDFQIAEARFRGNVQSNVNQLTGDNPNLPGLGASFASQREEYLRFAEAVSRGADIPQQCQGTGIAELGSCELVGAADREKGRLVYRFEDAKEATNVKPIILPKLTQLVRGNDTDEIVVVVVGRDLIIPRETYFNGQDAENDLGKRLVIIALKNGSGKGGNVYVTNRTTYLQANIFADGSLFSIPEINDYPGVNTVPLDNIGTRGQKQSQFFLHGSLVSGNTVGGCDAGRLRLGDGQVVTEVSPATRAQACAYDLNYLRYSPLVYSAEAGALVWPDSALSSLAWRYFAESEGSRQAAIERMAEGVEVVVDEQGETTPGDFGVVNFVYLQPPEELPGGFTFVGR